jgi:hypothetical protein
MLRHVRRHVQDCNSFGKDRDCPSKSKKKCPFWVEGRYGRTRLHQSLRTTDEKTAIRLVNRIIETGRLEFDEPRAAGVTVLQAIEGFRPCRGPQRLFGIAYPMLGSAVIRLLSFILLRIGVQIVRNGVSAPLRTVMVVE